MNLPFRIARYLLCLAAGVFLSLLELRFFEPAGIVSLPFFLILAATVPAVFLYFRSADSVAAPLTYTVALTLLLEALGRSVNVWVLLACLLALTVLYMNSRLIANLSRPNTGTSAPGLMLLTILLCGSIATASTFQIYRMVLRPNIQAGERLSLPERLAGLTASIPGPSESDAEQKSPPVPEQRAALAESAKGRNSAPALKEPGQPAPVFKILLVIAACAAILAAALAELRYRLWLRRMLALAPEQQIEELYRYLLRALEVCGYPRHPAQTPREYLESGGLDGAPVPRERLQAVTEAFVLARYGGRVSPEARDECLTLFRELPGLVKRGRGNRFYYLRYLPGMRRFCGAELRGSARPLTVKGGNVC